jgi:hypothetical protein
MMCHKMWLDKVVGVASVALHAGHLAKHTTGRGPSGEANSCARFVERFCV